MEKEFLLDQEDVLVTAVEEIKEEIVGLDYSEVSDEDYTTADENEIDWSAL